MIAFTEYRKQLEQALQAGNSTEHTHRPALKTLLETLQPGITATNEPRRVQCGAPDYIISRGQVPLGYIEAKDVGIPLGDVEKAEQLDRYRKGLGNLILTDYLEFRWYIGDEHRLTARLATVGVKGKLRPEPDGEARVAQLLQAFLDSSAPIVGKPRELAVRMANLAHLLRDALAESFGEEGDDGILHQQLTSFREVLLHDLSEVQFADMYAQTLCYGLFAARCNWQGQGRFNRQQAAYALPKTNPFLRKLFAHIAGPELDDAPFVWAVEDLTTLLDRANIDLILRDFARRTRQEDPVVHFYETFLAAYDPKLREARGVYYTPEPVVSYIVRSVDYLLKTRFNLPAGLADASKVTRRDGSAREVHKVQVLDPATGTGTFLHGVIDQIYEYQLSTGQAGSWNSYVSEHLLPRLFAFELLMAPYAVAHMKLGLQLAETGYDFHADERLRIYLTNTLQEAFELPPTTGFTRWLNEEAAEANEVKQTLPILVVLGNPPYSGHSANRGKWIKDLLHGKDTMTGKPTASYFEVDGQPLRERNPKWLNDDYVKFIRFAQWRIEQTGYGILAFITNHGYLDNPTFRGMRQSLMQTFDEIYILDLHGNSKKKERAPDGGVDENVFDIQQGVAIGIFLKQPVDSKQSKSLSHAEVWGERDLKYRFLSEYSVESTIWESVLIKAPRYYLKPLPNGLREEYNSGWQLHDIMISSSVGVVTGQDKEAIAMSPGDALKLSAGHGITSSDIVKIKYRPYDIRYIVYHPRVVTRQRYEIMRHMLNNRNIGLITTKQTRDAWGSLVTKEIIGHKSLAAYDINSLFPLYLYPDGKRNLFDGERTDASGDRRPNLAPEFIAEFSGKLDMVFIPDGKGDLRNTFGPEDIFAYMYAVFHSPEYRERYAEFLKTDFPRLPLTSTPNLFRALCGLGAELVALHLMEKTLPLITRFPVAGNGTVERVRYTEPRETEPGRVWINDTQYVDGVPPEVWAFHVGGYQVCEKWLKDRKDRQLTYDDLTHYQQVVAILAATIRLMSKIDEVIEEYSGWPMS